MSFCFCQEVAVIRQFVPLAVGLVVLVAPAIARAVELPARLTVGQQELVLNGSGAREQYFLDMYTAGLYLAQPGAAPAEIIAADAPMSIRIVITSRFVSQEKLVASLQDGLAASTGGQLEPIRDQTQQFRQCFADQIASGDVFDLVYLPGRGVIVLKNGTNKGTVAGLEFKRALFGIWLGERPVDDGLKQALLAGKAVR
jgi:hypothetical protein